MAPLTSAHTPVTSLEGVGTAVVWLWLAIALGTEEQRGNGAEFGLSEPSQVTERWSGASWHHPPKRDLAFLQRQLRLCGLERRQRKKKPLPPLPLPQPTCISCTPLPLTPMRSAKDTEELRGGAASSRTFQ